jgi:hypothetical protein
MEVVLGSKTILGKSMVQIECAASLPALERRRKMGVNGVRKHVDRDGLDTSEIRIENAFATWEIVGECQDQHYRCT